MLYEEPEELFICGVCSKSVESFLACNLHTETHVSKCFKCDFKSGEPLVLKAHEKANHVNLKKTTSGKHEEKKFSCDRCPLLFSTNSEFLLHSKTLHNANVFKCQRCEYEENSEEKLNAHGLIYHGIVKCDICDYAAEDVENMRNHMKKHTGTNVFTCDQCEFEATKQTMLESRIETKHSDPNLQPKLSESEYKCHGCEKTLPDDFNRKNHKCEPLKSIYPCEECEFKAKSIEEYFMHMKSHKKVLHSCSYCEFETKHETLLRAHILTQHEDSAIITTVATQQLMLCEAMGIVKEDLAGMFKTLLDGQNYIKSELFFDKRRNDENQEY